MRKNNELVQEYNFNIKESIQSNFPDLDFVQFLGSSQKNLAVVRNKLSKILTTLRFVPNVSRNEYLNRRKFFYLMEKVTHPNIIKYGQILYLKEESVLIITSQFGEISFKNMLLDVSKAKKCQQLFLEYFKQIIQGLKYLHNELKIIHGNLKLSNLLLIDDLIKISDFKDIKPHFHSNFAWNEFETIEYFPPEVLLLRDSNNINEKSDVWALGIILHQALTNQKHPFIANANGSNYEKMSVLKYQLSKNLRNIDPTLHETWYHEIIDQCLQYDPLKRPNISQLLSLIKDLEEKNMMKNKKKEPNESDALNAKIPIKTLAKALESFGVKNFDIDKTEYLFLNSQKEFFKNENLLSLFSEVLKLDYFNLLELNLNGNELSEMNKSNYFILVEGLKMNRSLVKLEVSRNGLGKNVEDFKLLCEALKNIKSIATLNLSDNLLGLHALNMKYLSEAILENQGLTTLDLCLNNLGKYSENMGFFWECLRDHKMISELNLANNDLGNSNDTIKLLADGIKYNKSLKVLNLSSNKIGKELQNIDNLTYSLKVNKSLSWLSLSNNDLGNFSGGVTMLSEYLIMTKNLIDLNISSNNLGKNIKSIKHLSKALRQNTSIFKLNLSDNKIGKEITTLLLNLIYNDSISNLILSENLLGNDLEIAETLAEYIQINETLEIMDISNNNFGLNSDSIRCLIESLKLNFNLKVLFLNDIKLKERVENLYVLASFLRAENSLTTIYLFNNEITDIDEEKFLSEKGQITIYR